jgi:hypothetical protein
MTVVVRAVAVLVMLLGFGAGCDDTRPEIERTVEELEAAIAAGDGERFVAGLAPETFQHYDRMVKLALDGTARQVQVLSLTEKLDIIVMRHRMTRRDLSKMDGRAWLKQMVTRSWGGNIIAAPEYVDHKNVHVRGSSATLEIVYDVRQPMFSGEGSGRKLSDRIDFIKVEDRWLADWRRPATLLERLVEMQGQFNRVSPERVLIGLVERASDKPVDTWILETPMK